MTWLLKNWRIASVAALILLVVLLYWRLDSVSLRLDAANLRTDTLEKAVADQAADIKNANETLSARAVESAQVQRELFDLRRNLTEVIKNDQIANEWSGSALPDSIVEWMRGNPNNTK